MKIYFILFAAISLVSFSCKKEVREIKATKETATVARPSLCTGNNWELDNIHKKGTYSLVYNNKVYVFNWKPSFDNTIHIYDGISWSSMRSNTPFGLWPNLGFTIGNKGYLIEFQSGVFTPANNEYDFATNTWEAKAGFPASHIHENTASAFSIGNKGYIVGGIRGNENKNEIWDYNPASNAWTQKNSFPQIGRGGATGFSIGNRGYIVGGYVRFPFGNIYLNELLEYDPATDSWDAKADFPGENRVHPSVFVISGAAYVGGGSNGETNFKDFYKYTPATNSWVKVADSPVPDKHRTHYSFTGFALNSKGYAVFYEPGNTVNTTPFMLKYNPRICIEPIPN